MSERHPSMAPLRGVLRAGQPMPISKSLVSYSARDPFCLAFISTLWCDGLVSISYPCLLLFYNRICNKFFLRDVFLFFYLVFQSINGSCAFDDQVFSQVLFFSCNIVYFLVAVYPLI